MIKNKNLKKIEKTRKNPKKPEKTQKKPLGWVFSKKPGFFPTLTLRDFDFFISQKAD